FAAPGAKGFSAAGLLARMPLSMTGLGIVTMLSQVHADYWLAGTVAATFVFCNALLAPQVSRLVDRFGQGRVLLPAALASALSMSALLLCTHYRAPN
ncbi:MFS transporter, partial [Pseudomonas aeruginosa]